MKSVYKIYMFKNDDNANTIESKSSWEFRQNIKVRKERKERKTDSAESATVS